MGILRPGLDQGRYDESTEVAYASSKGADDRDVSVAKRGILGVAFSKTPNERAKPAKGETIK